MYHSNNYIKTLGSYQEKMLQAYKNSITYTEASKDK